jgi:hypothetical protein
LTSRRLTALLCAQTSSDLPTLRFIGRPSRGGAVWLRRAPVAAQCCAAISESLHNPVRFSARYPGKPGAMCAVFSSTEFLQQWLIMFMQVKR